MKTIVKMVHGSHLYGLNTELSDMDYKGVFLPPLQDVVQYKVEHEISSSTGNDKTKNTSEDTDTSMYSVQKFIKMACDGETIALDMLHCPSPLESGSIWESIRSKRHMFYTKNMKAFLGYCKKQASKYGVRGSRLYAMEEILTYFSKKDPEARLSDVPVIFGLEGLSVANPGYVKVLRGFEKNGKWVNKDVLQVCESKYDLHCTVAYVAKQLKLKYDAYGHRAQLAKQNEGIDWKAISHALRAGFQLKEIYQTGDLQYPLKDAEFLLLVKQGKLDYTSVVAPMLEQLIETVEELAAKSEYPEKVDRQFWEGFIAGLYMEVRA